MTILKGSAEQQVQAVKDGNLLRGSELHLFGDGKEISQAHVLGAGSVGMGELDPKTGEYQKQAFWTDRMVYTKRSEKDQPPLDVLTFLGKDGSGRRSADTSGGQLQEIEADQLKVCLKTPDKQATRRQGEARGRRRRTRRPSRRRRKTAKRRRHRVRPADATGGDRRSPVQRPRRRSSSTRTT